MNVITINVSEGNESLNSQVNDKLDILPNESDCLHDDTKEAVAIAPKENLLLFFIHIILIYVPFPSSLMETKVNEVEDEDYLDTKICFL